MNHIRRAMKPLPTRRMFVRHIIRKAVLACGIVTVSLMLGACGYHFTEGLPWLDATLNASMILTGMGPVDALQTPAGKVFGIFYSLFSGVVFLTMAALLFAPVLHRFLHRFHMDLESDEPAKE